MKRYRFEVWEQLITPIEILAKSEQEARERVSRRDPEITCFDAVRGESRLVLRSVGSK